MNADLLRFVDSISRDKNIEKESIFCDLEAAMVSAAQKAFPDAEDVQVSINRMTGERSATVDGEPIDMHTLGRIAAQTAKQVMMQKIREDERNSIFEEYSQRVGEVIAGTVSRYDGGFITVNMGRAEGFLPRSEQIPGDNHQPGERIRAMVLDVREEQNRVKIVLTQTHPDYIRKLFELEVPEVAERIIEIKALAREAGYRTKLAVSSIDSKVDAVGACVGVRGSRIRNIVDELGGEKIDIVRWNESSQVLISNALKPAEVKETFLCFELGRATVIVDEDQLSLAIGKRGQNVRLAARLTGWDIDIVTPAEYDRNIDNMQKSLAGIEGLEDVMLDKMLAMGLIRLADVAEVGVEPIVSDLEVNEEVAARIVEVAASEAKRISAEEKAAKEAAKIEAAEEAKRAAEAAANPDAEEVAADTETTTDGGEEIAEAPDAVSDSANESSDGESPAGDAEGAGAEDEEAVEKDTVKDVDGETPTDGGEEIAETPDAPSDSDGAEALVSGNDVTEVSDPSQAG